MPTWKQISNIKGPEGPIGMEGRSIQGPPGRDGRDSGTVHRVPRLPDELLGKDGDWAFNEAKEIFYRSQGKWKFYISFFESGGVSTTTFVNTTNDMIKMILINM
jgi:hypothetical protein